MSGQNRPTADAPLDALKDEFRRHLQLFYSRLKLASPYDSVEKALRQLIASVAALPAADQHRLLSDEALRWAHYRRAFIDSGLSQKHRGIIAGLAQQRGALDLPPEFDHFLDLYIRR
ncbi:MAG: hypothetical protein NW701_09645 [Nitrospira sp.]